MRAIGHSPIVHSEACDFNNDSHLDFIVGTLDGFKLILFLNDGNGTFTTFKSSETEYGLKTIVANDINADGKTDLVVAKQMTNEINVFPNQC